VLDQGLERQQPPTMVPLCPFPARAPLKSFHKICSSDSLTIAQKRKRAKIYKDIDGVVYQQNKKQKTLRTAKGTAAATTNNNKKAVRFAPPDKLDTIINQNFRWMEDDLYHAWYQRRDYVIIKLGILSSIHAIGSAMLPLAPSALQEIEPSSTSEQAAIASVPSLDLSEHCMRGIETGISMEVYQQRKMHIHTTTQSVLEQQRVSRCLGVALDPQILRAISMQLSQAALESALAMAAMDANESKTQDG